MTDTLTLQRRRRFTASSSQRVEEVPGPSGLPAQASIARCPSSTEQPEEWGAWLERLGQERSRVEELPAHLPGRVEEGLFEELASALLQHVWIGEAGHLRGWTDRVVLTSAHHGSGAASAGGYVFLVHLKPTSAAHGAGALEERVSVTGEAVIPDTDRACTVEQLARAWEALGQPVSEDDVPLSVDPDDYPLF